MKLIRLILFFSFLQSAAYSQDFDVKINEINKKYFFEIYSGTGISNQQTVRYEDQATFYTLFEKSNSPLFRIGFHIGVDYNYMISRSTILSVGARYQHKGGFQSIYFLPGVSSYFYDVIPTTMLQLKAEYWLHPKIGLLNGITLGSGNRGDTSFEFEAALISGLKVKLSRKFSTAIYYNQGLNTLHLRPLTQRRFYSFDLSLFYKFKLFIR